MDKLINLASNEDGIIQKFNSIIDNAIVGEGETENEKEAFLEHAETIKKLLPRPEDIQGKIVEVLNEIESKYSLASLAYSSNNGCIEIFTMLYENVYYDFSIQKNSFIEYAGKTKNVLLKQFASSIKSDVIYDNENVRNKAIELIENKQILNSFEPDHFLNSLTPEDINKYHDPMVKILFQAIRMPTLGGKTSPLLIKTLSDKLEVTTDNIKQTFTDCNMLTGGAVIQEVVDMYMDLIGENN